MILRLSMSSLAKLLLLLAVVGTRVAMAEPPWTLRNLVLDLNEQDTLVFKLLNEKGVETLTGALGAEATRPLGLPVAILDDNHMNLSWGPGPSKTATLDVTLPNEHCVQLSWKTEILSMVEDCIDIGDGYWYGGPEELNQHFPMSPVNSRERVPYLPGDMLQDKDLYFGGVAEPYWLNSKGGAIWVHEEQPLFYSWNSNRTSGQLCLSTVKSLPYPVHDGDSLELNYMMCSADDPKQMQMYAASNLWTKPTSLPDTKMFSDPIWSTWAQYKADINQSVVAQFADDIISHGFQNSQLEIDDNWETCYGDAKFNPSKFPDPALMVSQLKEMGFRVTLWVHPFVNLECPSFMEAAYPPAMYFVRDTKGKGWTIDGWSGAANLPGLTWWWQGFAAGYVDFTNPEAVEWWSSRLAAIRSEYGIDSFKFDAGESNWLPSSFIFPNEDKRTWPGIFSTRYVESVAAFGSMIEVRTARHSQHLPVFLRMLDKDSVWGYDNGLKSMVTTLLQFGMVGYPFVLPDMIGGNGYGGLPGRELYIRWLQVNALMPAVQISFVPWIYDEEVTQHARDMVALHQSFAPTIVALAEEAVETGLPINRPIWWIDPTDQIALGIDSEFLLGNDILVAPVLEEGAVKRDIYLPAGDWLDVKLNIARVGPGWIQDYPADLFTLPYFIRQ